MRTPLCQKICSPHTGHQQNGAALAETLLALLPVLFLGSVCIELARAYQMRHLLLLSLHQAARVAAVHHAAPQTWLPVLDRALRPHRSCLAFTQRFKLPCWEAIELAASPETIHLRLTYVYQPLQEWLRVALQQVVQFNVNAATSHDPPSLLSQHAWRHGLIPMVVDYRILRHRSIGWPAQRKP